MHLWEGVVLAMHQIRSEKMKSFFSLLGVIMGVMFLIVVVTIVEGLDQYVRVEVTSQVFGINTVTVRRWGEAGVDNDREAWRARLRSPRLRYEDADAIRERLTVPALIGVESDTGRIGRGGQRPHRNRGSGGRRQHRDVLQSAT